MKKMRSYLLLLSVCILSVQQASAWGSTGHRAIAEIAYGQLSAKTKAKVKDILGNDYLPLFANWADEIRSDKDNPYNSLPHYVNMPLDAKYEQADKNPKGDLVSVMENMVEMLQSKTSSNEEKAIALKFIIHLVGDAHQPMHVALSEDLGGNRVEVQWFRQKSNLHKLWDEDLIDYSRLSYKELAVFAGEPQKEELREWQNISVVDWIDETHEITKNIYENLGDKNYSYVYNYQYSPVVYQQIQKAGYRLALFLNKLLE
ncbi:S1/P1 nuclease [Carboxylicivirga linearis]|uniref:S1/P1 nuclease n=1 Tax=Carboxylicivirga linearis TaxID=1628157 RepID=A0ABS5JVJ8_9BACT|nr:S1/P1 nuclease [Carboxylicivirga linearis]MBS2098927.1 S1/P1 nuclease [Carboxylicivirga linearis]